MEKLRTSPYQPSTNGVCERFHGTLNRMLAKAVSESQRDWDTKIPMVLMAYRASRHTSTGYSPNRLFLGRENCLPIDLVLGRPKDRVKFSSTTDEFVQAREAEIEAAFRLARGHCKVTAERRKKTYDVRVKEQFQYRRLGILLLPATTCRKICQVAEILRRTVLDCTAHTAVELRYSEESEGETSDCSPGQT